MQFKPNKSRNLDRYLHRLLSAFLSYVGLTDFLGDISTLFLLADVTYFLRHFLALIFIFWLTNRLTFLPMTFFDWKLNHLLLGRPFLAFLTKVVTVGPVHKPFNRFANLARNIHAFVGRYLNIKDWRDFDFWSDIIVWYQYLGQFIQELDIFN